MSRRESRVGGREADAFRGRRRPDAALAGSGLAGKKVEIEAIAHV
jgi:hypothetical protein